MACIDPFSSCNSVSCFQIRTNFHNRVINGTDPFLTAGQVVFAQMFQKDPSNTAGGFADSLSDGVGFTIVP